MNQVLRNEDSWGRGFCVLIAAAFLALTATRMTQLGMFLDGVTYAAISRNLGAGIGSFWFPSYTETVYPQFHEQPPLGLALQGAAFALFGDNPAVERIYSLVIACLTAITITALWRSTVGYRAFAWLPLAFWLLPAMVTWSIVNNMLENTQAFFSTIAVFFVVHAGMCRGGKSLLSGVLAAAAVIAAFLTKGPVGLFPMAAPIILALTVPMTRKRAVRCFVVMLTAAVVGGAVLALSHDARIALSSYWHQHLVAAVAGARERAPNRWTLARHLIGGILLWMTALFALALAGAKKAASSTSDLDSTRWARFYFGVALAASLPIAVSAKIAGHYLVPSVPMYALGFAALALPATRALLSGPRAVVAGRVAERIGLVLLLMVAIVLPFGIGTVGRRDGAWLAEYRALKDSIPRGETMSTCAPLAGDWGLHAYMQRLYRVSLDPSDQPRRFFFKRTDVKCEAPPQCTPIVSTERIVILDCAGERPRTDADVTRDVTECCGSAE